MDKRNYISLSDKHKNTLKDHFKVSMNTIRNALNYFTHSEQAKNIRKKAKELLANETKSVKI